MDSISSTQYILHISGAFTLDAKQPKFDVIDNLRKVSTGGKLREWLFTLT